MSKRILLGKIIKSIVEMEDEETKKLSQEALDTNIPAQEIVTKGLAKGMDEVIRLFEEEEYYIPEVLICSDAFNAGLEVVKPYLNKKSNEKSIKVVLGVVEGDTHDIGKNLVKIMMQSSGIKVYDLGRDVSLDDFIDKAEEVEADIIAMSTLMTTTMDGMRVVINKLKERGIRDKYKVMIGGGPTSENFANFIGADIYTENASEATRIVKIEG